MSRFLLVSHEENCSRSKNWLLAGSLKYSTQWYVMYLSIMRCNSSYLFSNAYLIVAFKYIIRSPSTGIFNITYIGLFYLWRSLTFSWSVLKDNVDIFKKNLIVILQVIRTSISSHFYITYLFASQQFLSS